jgi:hypothetical protein
VDDPEHHEKGERIGAVDNPVHREKGADECREATKTLWEKKKEREENVVKLITTRQTRATRGGVLRITSFDSFVIMIQSLLFVDISSFPYLDLLHNRYVKRDATLLAVSTSC